MSFLIYIDADLDGDVNSQECANTRLEWFQNRRDENDKPYSVKATGNLEFLKHVIGNSNLDISSSDRIVVNLGLKDEFPDLIKGLEELDLTDTSCKIIFTSGDDKMSSFAYENNVLFKPLTKYMEEAGQTLQRGYKPDQKAMVPLSQRGGIPETNLPPVSRLPRI